MLQEKRSAMQRARETQRPGQPEAHRRVWRQHTGARSSGIEVVSGARQKVGMDRRAERGTRLPLRTELLGQPRKSRAHPLSVPMSQPSRRRLTP